MSFHHEHTLAGYARAAVDLKARMVDHHRSPLAGQYLTAFLTARLAHHPEASGEPSPATLLALRRVTAEPWRSGDTYVLAPAMTAIVAAATEALDLTGEVLPDDLAPSNGGVLFLPEPIYHRAHTGEVWSIAAITWARVHDIGTGRSSWMIAGWSDNHDPLDPTTARRHTRLAGAPKLARQFGPYVLTEVADIPIGRPVDPRPDPPTVDDDDRDWQPAPDGRYCIDDTTVRANACAAIAYAFWAIQAQPLAVAAHAPLDRAARRRAVRASISHDTRVVMLRRTSPITEPGDTEPRWHYRVRFLVRGHWRRLTDKHGQPYKIWINAHIRSVDRTTGVSCR